MARHRFHAAELTKLLESASQPLYVLDDALAIVYLNDACRNWLADEAEKLIGRKCVYHSVGELSGPDAVAAGLCPPPAVLEGREVSASVARLSAPKKMADLRPRRRFAASVSCRFAGLMTRSCASLPWSIPAIRRKNRPKSGRRKLTSLRNFTSNCSGSGKRTRGAVPHRGGRGRHARHAASMCPGPSSRCYEC